MNIFNKELINSTLNFLKNLSCEDRIAVIHHTDPDGITSGVLMYKLIERLRGKQPELRHNQPGTLHGFTKKTLKLLQEKKINKVITTDITVEENYENWKKIEKFAKILIIDHHPLKYEKTEQTIIVKPQLFTKDVIPSKYCAAKLVYDIASRLVNMTDLDWLAAIGVITDITTDCWEDFLTKVFKKYNFVKGENWFDSLLGKAGNVMSSAECYDESIVYKIFNIVYNAKTPFDIINSELKQYQEVIQKEINYWVSNFDKKAKIQEDIIYYEINPKYNVKSSVSTILGLKNPNKTIFVVSKEKNNFLISARRSDYKKNMGEILKKATEKIPNSTAGGHIPAAGATVPLEHYNEFKKKLFKILKNG